MQKPKPNMKENQGWDRYKTIYLNLAPIFVIHHKTDRPTENLVPKHVRAL